MHGSGALAEARPLYDVVLTLRPGDPDGLHLLGVLRAAQGAADVGVALIDKAIAGRPAFPTAWFNRGNILAGQGRHQAALDSVLQCLALAPDHAGALAVAGRSLQALGRMAEAADHLGRAAEGQAGDAMLWNDYGVALTQCGRIPEATEAFRQTVRIAPGYAQGYRNLGTVLLAGGFLPQAHAAFTEALRLDPSDLQPHLHLAAIAEAQGRLDDALGHLAVSLRQNPANRPAHCPDNRHARLQRIRLLCAAQRHVEAVADLNTILTHDPNDIEALALRGGAYWELLDLDAAEADLDRVLAAEPDRVAVRIDRGNVLQDRGAFAAALAEYDHALAVEPDNLTALTNRGTTLQALHRCPEALAAYDRVLAVDPDRSDVQFSRGICLLRMGRWRDGWTGFEARWRPWAAALEGFAAPRWDGSADLAGKRILVAGEQGLGDMIQFARFAPILTGLGATVIVSVEPPLQRLMHSLAGVEAIGGPSDTPAYDLYCLMMSLPALLGLEEAQFPATEPYLRAEARDVAAWRGRLSVLPGLKVGLVWAGDPRPDDRPASRMDRRRSVPLRVLAPLLDTPGCTFVSLQKGPAAQEAAGHRLLDWSGELYDFADTAALMTALDLVISVDTSVVHAAGALGRPVWVLNRYDGCWRWRSGRDDTPWYPTMRLFTQATPGDWDSVIGRVGEALENVASAQVL